MASQHRGQGSKKGTSHSAHVDLKKSSAHEGNGIARFEKDVESRLQSLLDNTPQFARFRLDQQRYRLDGLFAPALLAVRDELKVTLKERGFTRVIPAIMLDCLDSKPKISFFGYVDKTQSRSFEAFVKSVESKTGEVNVILATGRKGHSYVLPFNHGLSCEGLADMVEKDPALT